MTTPAIDHSHEGPRAFRCASLDGVNPDHRAFYVTAIDGHRSFFLAGPWDTYAEADAHVSIAREIACEGDVRAHWMAFGVTGCATPIKSATPLGTLGSEAEDAA